MEDLQRSFNQLTHGSSAQLLGNSQNNNGGDASESLYEEVDVLSPVKADASSYLSGVGDLMISGSNSASVAAGRAASFTSSFLSPRSPSSSRRASNNSRQQPKSMPHIDLVQPDDAVEEEVIEEEVDDDLEEEEVVLDATEVEYYEDEELDIEEIELDDDLYEEMVMPSPSNVKPQAGRATSSSSAGNSNPPRPASSDTAPTFEDADTDQDDEDDDEEPDLPSREEVAEAITYMVRQEKVVEYGLLTKKQVDEMNDLPLEEMMEIMKHFEICDNNNATIQWDLVLAMINPDYSPDAVAATNDDDEDDDDDDEENDQAQPLVGGASSSASRGGARRRRSSGASSQRSGGTHTGHEDDGDDTVTDIHAFAASATGQDAGDLMMGSSYSLEVADPSETGLVSNLTAADCAADQAAGGFDDDDDDDDVEYQEETLHGSMVSIDPLIRASYTKSMVELQMSRPARGKDEGG